MRSNCSNQDGSPSWKTIRLSYSSTHFERTWISRIYEWMKVTLLRRNVPPGEGQCRRPSLRSKALMVKINSFLVDENLSSGDDHSENMKYEIQLAAPAIFRKSFEG